MKLKRPDYLVLIVTDLDRSLSFYTGSLGLALGHRSGDYAQLATGDTRLALFSQQAMSTTLGMTLDHPDPRAPGFQVGFKVDDVDAAFRELVEQGVPPVTPPIDRPWGQRTAYVRDPDGHLIELVQAIARSDKTDAPNGTQTDMASRRPPS